MESEAGIKRSLRNRNEFTWHDENSNFSSMNAKHGNYDLTYKSLTWMYTFVTNGINSTEIKAFGERDCIRLIKTVVNEILYLNDF